MTSPFDAFLARAREVTIADVAVAFGLPQKGAAAEQMGPCPACGGRDCFGWNRAKNAWNCRAGGVGGRDAISLAAHLKGFDLSRREGLALACEQVLNETAPDGSAQESDEERAAREAQARESLARAQAKAASREAEANAFREKEVRKARGKWLNAFPLRGTDAADYLYLRTGFRPQSGGFLRQDGALDYWIDENGTLESIHSGPAMIAPFIDADGQVVGCHQTWIDLSRHPKFRPDLGLDRHGDPRPTKKMRGTKQGGLIPIAGWMLLDDGRIVPAGPPASGSPLKGGAEHPRHAKTRMVVGEGIENVVAVGGAERFRTDTLYAAAGDLGNLAGRADPQSFFWHPDRKKADKNGVLRPVRVPGVEPDFKSAAMPVPASVETLVLLADGDSERVFTAAAMVRAKRRHAREGLVIAVAWPLISGDFADLLQVVPAKVSANGVSHECVAGYS